MEYCYAVCFSNGLVKFGRTSDLQGRLSSHVANGQAHDAICLCALVSGSLNSRSDEKRLLTKAAERMDKFKFGNEYFKGTPEDAMSVMVSAELLPIPSYPHMDGNSIRFSIAKVGFDFSGIKLVKDRAKKPIKRLIMDHLNRETMGQGILINKCRSWPRADVIKALEELSQSGHISLSETINKKNGIASVRYSFRKRLDSKDS